MQRKLLPEWDDVALQNEVSYRSALPPQQFRGIATGFPPSTTPITHFSLDDREKTFKSELARDRMSPIHFRKNLSHVKTPKMTSSRTAATSPDNNPDVQASPSPDPAVTPRNTRHQQPSDIYPSSHSSLLLRERLLHLITAATTVINDTTTIDKAVTNTATFDTKLLSSLFAISLPPSAATEAFPELSILEGKFHCLVEVLQKCFLGLAEQYEGIEKAYKHQLMEVKLIANQATRNAIQAEKTSTSTAITTLQQQHHAELTHLQTQLHEASATITSLQQAVAAAEDKASTASQAAMVMGQEYEDKIANMAHEIEKQVSVRLEAARSDLLGRGDLYEKRIAEIKENHEAQLLLLKSHHTDQLALLTNEGRQKEGVVLELNQRIAALQQQLQEQTFKQSFVVSEAVNTATAQAKEVSDQQISELHASLAQHKLEIAELKEKIQLHANSQEDELELELSKQRNALVSRHQDDLAAVAAKHNQEIRKLKALVEVKANELNGKSKRLYDQEITRLVAENDRLRRQLARTSSTTAVPAPATASSMSTRQTPITTPAPTITTPGAAKPKLRSTAIPTANNTPARQSSIYVSKDSSSRWGQMSVSMLQQELQDDVSPPASPPLRSSDKPLPHAFPLEVAFQSSRKSNGSIGEQQNIVGRYMGQLQKYIEGQPITTADSIFDESNSLLRPHGMFSSSSSDDLQDYDDAKDDDSLD